jgi:class 3 adenylate cyclase
MTARLPIGREWVAPSATIPRVAQVVDDPVAAGRAAALRRSWTEAYETLKPLEPELGPEDLEYLADAAFWTRRIDESLPIRERAHAAHLDAGDRLRAASTAVRLSLDYLVKFAFPLASGWQAKAERLLADEPESVEHGRAAIVRAVQGEGSGRFDESIAEAERAYAIATRFGDRDLQALALVVQGASLVFKGELDKGLALLDEASTSALTGELDPYSATVIYCMTITGAQGVGDFERARQWTDAANRWCDAEGTHGFPGACRVHRSEILWLGGHWDAAEREAVDACSELAPYNVVTTAVGFYQIGEIHRRRGDFAAAAEAYRKTHELGREPQPGLALLRLAEGRTADAVSGLRRSLCDQEDLSTRARWLPAQVDVSLAVGDLEAARTAAAELEAITDRFRVNGERTPLLDGRLQLALSRIASAEEDWAAMETTARRALGIWTRVGAPYEAAEARVALGMAYDRQGDRAGAHEEYEAAQAVFERLGAVLDVQRTMELLGDAAATRRTFVFTDIVDSTRLLDALGEQKWKKLLDRHDELLGSAIRGRGGEVIKHTGDGFFAAFDTAAAAVEASVQIQRALVDELFEVRIGIHSGEALERGNDYTGRGVNVAARIGALADSGQILVSAETVDGMPVPYTVCDGRTEKLQGFEEPVPIVAIRWK